MSVTLRKCEDCRNAETPKCGACDGPNAARTEFQYRVPYAIPAAQAAQGAANARQVGGSHYQKAIQPWDYIAANGIGYFEGNVIKYVSRWKDKAGVEDLKKARHYLDKLIELQGEGK